MKDLPFTWKDYLLEQLDEEHVRTKLTELQEAFAKEDEEPRLLALSYCFPWRRWRNATSSCDRAIRRWN